ncbi:DUF397 domain-containing protein [Bailinhaonella thermotolerans]|uniref:DUF397 domain-containing protein n=1 Tax=Bailinhaonella thermotolerans TaxID=1070861 RepID=A0A3A4BGY8_9ACTN|nr:DUF397 domain-containing protein [Bailinhaonella thermotolerans]RJL30552.1 DUF397 domain-containing protein [Bailinhaonella thermotolerans]
MSEFPMAWRKSSYSSAEGDNCVEVARAGGGRVAVRDSKDPEGGALAFGREEWARFLLDVKRG